MFFKIGKSRSECPVVMHVRAPDSSLILTEIACILPVNHEGPHRGKGLLWSNSEAMLRQWAEQADPVRKKLHLVKR